uniref:(northern house mosquito) hypothetical protein n=1 Tax=Culex pipiens TaxID=7175 RepID=A0A8D8CGE9_CULPI
MLGSFCLNLFGQLLVETVVIFNVTSIFVAVRELVFVESALGAEYLVALFAKGLHVAQLAEYFHNSTDAPSPGCSVDASPRVVWLLLGGEPLRSHPSGESGVSSTSNTPNTSTVNFVSTLSFSLAESSRFGSRRSEDFHFLPLGIFAAFSWASSCSVSSPVRTPLF